MTVGVRMLQGRFHFQSVLPYHFSRNRVPWLEVESGDSLTIGLQEIAQQGSLLHADHRTVCPGRPRGPRVLYTPSRICLGICFAVTLSVPCGAAMEAPNAPLPGPRETVQRARVDPHTINLPITDGKDVRFTRLSVA